MARASGRLCALDDVGRRRRQRRVTVRPFEGKILLGAQISNFEKKKKKEMKGIPDIENYSGSGRRWRSH